jgi:hypothetical protein
MAVAGALPCGNMLLYASGSFVDDPLGIRLVGPAAGLAVFVAMVIFRGYRLLDTVSVETVPVRR